MHSFWFRLKHVFQVLVSQSTSTSSIEISGLKKLKVSALIGTKANPETITQTAKGNWLDGTGAPVKYQAKIFLGSAVMMLSGRNGKSMRA